MKERFVAKKTDILSRLSKPSDSYADASPKGSIDEDIRDLVDRINRISGLVTTSSCSGRISVFLEGAEKPSSVLTSDNIEASSDTVKTSAGGKGGGRWLCTSHAPINLERLTGNGAAFERLGFPQQAQVSFPTAEERPQFVHFKLEPLILHILTATTELAQSTLTAALSAGFRESGISSITDKIGQSTPPMVAVRSTGLGLDSIIGFKSTPDSRQITPMVSEEYLRTLLRIANERFRINEERKVRFYEALVDQGVCQDPSSGFTTRHKRGFESSAARSVRMREEGLRRQEEMLEYYGALDGASQGGSESTEVAELEDDEDSFGFDLLEIGNDEDAGPTQSQEDGNVEGYG